MVPFLWVLTILEDRNEGGEKHHTCPFDAAATRQPVNAIERAVGKVVSHPVR